MFVRDWQNVPFKRVLTCDWHWYIFSLKMDLIWFPRDTLSDASPSNVAFSWLLVIRGGPSYDI